MQNPRTAFKNRFQDFVNRRISKDKKEELFGAQFSSPPPPVPSSKFSSSNTSNIISPSIRQQDNSSSFIFTPRSPQSNSSFISYLDSSEFDYSKYKSSKQKCKQEESAQRKRLKKLREMEENECAICLDQITNRCQLECHHKFCHQCLLGWLANTNRCPYCRSEGEKHPVQPKEYQYEAEDDRENLDWVCYNCDHTNDGDIVLICDRCEAHACHIDCDETLHGVEPQGQWYCHFCRG